MNDKLNIMKKYSLFMDTVRQKAKKKSFWAAELPKFLPNKVAQRSPHLSGAIKIAKNA